VRGHIQDAVANGFASATEGVLIGMAIALGVSFLVALRYPRAAAEVAAAPAEAGA
jgi:hypothetical protein